MNAQEMFEELGFNVMTNNDECLIYHKNGDSYSHSDEYAPCYINFRKVDGENSKAQDVIKYRVYIDNEDRSNTREFLLGRQEYIENAIHLQKREFGWI